MSSNDKRIYYNINFPCLQGRRCKGTRVTCQSLAYLMIAMKIEVQTHKTGEGFMIYGEKDIETSNGYDSRALMNNHITITPLFFDATAYNAMQPVFVGWKKVTEKGDF